MEEVFHLSALYICGKERFDNLKKQQHVHSLLRSSLLVERMEDILDEKLLLLIGNLQCWQIV